MHASGVGGVGVGGGGGGDLFFSPTAGRDGVHVGQSPNGGGGRMHGGGGHEHDSERDDFIPMSPADLASSRTDKSLPGRFPYTAPVQSPRFAREGAVGSTRCSALLAPAVSSNTHAPTAPTLTLYTLPLIRPTWHRGGGLFEADSAGVGAGAGPIPYESTPQGKPHSRSQGPGEETNQSERRGEGRGQEQDGEELTLLRSQLQAVQNIRRELDKKDIEVNSLRQENNTLRLGTTAR